jgi:hypothetical protein
MAVSRMQLGAPGIYRRPLSVAPALPGERLDICAFVGVAVRGPAWVPVVDERWRVDQPTVGAGRARRRSVARRVTSWAEFVRVYGGLRGPGRLPWAVRAFFDQGGAEAWIVRITAPVEFDAEGDPEGIGRAALSGLELDGAKLRLFARDEGAWSRELRVSLGFARTPQPFEAALSSATALSFASAEAPAPGTLLRASFPGLGTELRYVTGLVPDHTAQLVHASLSAPWMATPAALERVSAELWLEDGAGHEELHRELGLSALHPRWIATVLCHESALAFPDPAWVEALVLDVDPRLPALDRTRTTTFADGKDRYAALEVAHFFDPSWDPRGDRPGVGIAALADVPEVASLVVPDLYHPRVLLEEDEEEGEELDLGSPDWVSCLELEAPPAPPPQTRVEVLPGLLRDANADFEAIVASQDLVVRLAERLEIVALLDVPPGLEQRRILEWSQRFASSWAAAYYPWLRLAPTSEEPARETPVRLGPAAVAAGIIARHELVYGIPHGPANHVAAGVVDVEDRVSPRRHDELHPRGINVFLREREGVRLTAARTLARDRNFRQLSVRRLFQLLERSLQRQLRWVVFEPNGARLRERLGELLRVFLRELHRQGAFRGAREEDAFFVRCDRSDNPPAAVERGELLAEIGVAPSEPVEFIVLALLRAGDELEVVER